MNFDFQDPFGTSRPKAIERIIDDAFCANCSFSRNGQFMAVGCFDGSIKIYETLLFTKITELKRLDSFVVGEVYKIMEFNSKGDQLICLTVYGQLICWNLLNSELISTYDSRKCDGDLIYFCSFFINSKFEEIILTVRGNGIVEQYSNTDSRAVGSVGNEAPLISAEIGGQYLFSLDSDSSLYIFDIELGKLCTKYVDDGKGIFESSSGFVDISCHSTKPLVALISKNRFIRVVEFEAQTFVIESFFKLADPVNKWLWRDSGFSSTDSYDSILIWGTSVSKGRHLIYLWDIMSETLVQALEGPKEEVSLIKWHPKKPVFVSVGSQTGKIYVWGPAFKQNWAALVPKIESLETNIEYIESEDEFDLPCGQFISNEMMIDELSVSLDWNDFYILDGTSGCQDNNSILYYPIDNRRQ